MFEQIAGGSVGARIVVQTRLGRSIDNEIRPFTSHDRQRADVQYHQYRIQFGNRWIQRKSACGGYNCFGMLFASRRTGIFEASEVEKILHDDGYELLDDVRSVRTGDIVLYRLKPSGELAHGSRVVTVVPRKPVPDIWVLSKWNIGWGEDIHPIGEICMENSVRHWEIWTERNGS
ncbi:MAG: hypothetical protein WEA31_09890 [Pirellulales bacterium]